MNESELLAKAYVFIADAAISLSHGVKHYSIDGKLLPTVKDIAEALLRDKRIIMEKPNGCREN